MPFTPESITVGLAVLCILLYAGFLVPEWRAGRFRSAAPPLQITPEIIRRDILELFPQLDQPGGSADDLSLLARLIARRRILSHLHSGQQDSLQLVLAIPRERLTIEERKLAALLFGAEGWTSTARLRLPLRPRVLETHGFVHKLTRLLGILLWVGLSISSCVHVGFDSPEKIRYQLLTFLFFPVSLLVVALAGANANDLRSPRSSVLRVLFLAAIAPAIVAWGIHRFDFPADLSAALALLGLTTFLDALQAARIRQTPEEIARRHQAIATAEMMEKAFGTAERLRAYGFDVTSSGIKPTQRKLRFALAVLLFMILVGVLVAEESRWSYLAAPLKVLALVEVVALIVVAVKKKPRTLTPGVLSRDAGPTPRARVVEQVEPEEIRWTGDRSSRAGLRGRADGVSWRLKTGQLTILGDSELSFDYTVWTTEKGAIGGTLVFWPAASLDDARALLASLRFWGTTGMRLPSLDHISPLPVDDERLLHHFRIESSEEINATHLSPALKDSLAGLGNMIGRSESDIILRRLAVIAFWQQGLLILSSGRADNDESVRRITALGVQLASALRE